MGYARPRPKRLAAKLLQIRTALGLSQAEMWRRLGLGDEIPSKRISTYEINQNEPPLKILLQYARVAGVNMEALADDELDLPDNLPATTNHEEIKRKFAPRRESKKR